MYISTNVQYTQPKYYMYMYIHVHAVVVVYSVQYMYVPSDLCVQCACGADEPEPGKWSAQSLPPLRTHKQ